MGLVWDRLICGWTSSPGLQAALGYTKSSKLALKSEHSAELLVHEIKTPNLLHYLMLNTSQLILYGNRRISRLAIWTSLNT